MTPVNRYTGGAVEWRGHGGLIHRRRVQTDTCRRCAPPNQPGVFGGGENYAFVHCFVCRTVSFFAFRCIDDASFFSNALIYAKGSQSALSAYLLS